MAGEVERLDGIGARFFASWVDADPFRANVHGLAGGEDRVPDLSEDGTGRRRDALAGLLDEVGAVDAAGLDRAGEVRRETLRFHLECAIARIDARWPEVTVATNEIGPQAKLLQQVSKAGLHTAELASAYLARLDRLGGYLDQAAACVAAGTAAGRTVAARVAGQVVAQLDAYLADPADDPLLRPSPAPGAGVAPDWEDRRRALLQDVVGPAMARYRDVLRERVLPAARDDERCGIGWIPGGESLYAQAVREHTSTGMSPDDIHRLGLDTVAALEEEYATLGERALGIGEVARLLAFLPRDRSMRFDTEAQVIAAAEDAVARAVAVQSRMIGRPPRAPLAVRPKPVYDASDATIGYQPPADDGSRPGIYWLTTLPVDTRLRFEAEALAFHEGIPGHHTQFALAAELDDVPDFQRHVSVSAHAEGWALYAERVADEFGLYTSEVSRLGMLSLDSRRACRLVVDTGIHHLGWSRARAVEYLRAHSPQNHDNIEGEVDRYIGWPGQALSYMVGRHRIDAMRRTAERALAARFSLPTFHDWLLENGAVPLSVLERSVDRRIAEAG